MNIRRFIFIFGLILISGCATTDLWKNPRYTETINQFLITSNGKKLVIIGNEYHYIFSNQNELIELLNWQGRNKLTAEFNEFFVVNKDDVVTGNYLIKCICKLDNSQSKWLANIGFVESDNGIYELHNTITGERFLSNNLPLDGYSRLNDEYHIQVEEPFTPFGYVWRTALTPITVAEDGILTIGVAGLLVIGLPFYVGEIINDQDSKNHTE